MSTDTGFAAPGSTGSGDTLSPADCEGHLLVVEPTEYVANIVTSFGEKDAIRCTVHDITAQSTSVDVLWFPGGIIGALKGRLDQRVLAVMTRGTAKAGQSPPWLLQDASTSPEAVNAATAYLTGQVAATLAPVAAAAPPVTKAKVAAAPVPAQSALDAALGNLQSAGLT